MSIEKRGDEIRIIGEYAKRKLSNYLDTKWFLESEGCIPKVWYIINENGVSNVSGNGFLLGVDIELVNTPNYFENVYSYTDVLILLSKLSKDLESEYSTIQNPSLAISKWVEKNFKIN